MKDVITNEMLRGAGSKLWSEGLRMRKLLRTLYWIYKYWVANLENWNILVSRGKESKNDSLSSGERMGKSLNHTSVWGSGKVTNKKLEEIPGRVYRRKWQSCIWKRKKNFIPSSMEHVKFRVNQRGPPRKAKYSWMTDSETVPRGKGEKNPGRGVK